MATAMATAMATVKKMDNTKTTNLPYFLSLSQFSSLSFEFGINIE